MEKKKIRSLAIKLKYRWPPSIMVAIKFCRLLRKLQIETIFPQKRTLLELHLSKYWNIFLNIDEGNIFCQEIK